MFDLDSIKAMNDRAVVNATRVEDNHNRECSYSGDSDRGLVLHSALRRSTVFVAGRNTKSAKAAEFLAAWFGTNSQDRRNSLVESHFI